MDKVYLRRFAALVLLLVMFTAMSGSVAFASPSDPEPADDGTGDDGTGTGTADEPPKTLPFICLISVNADGDLACVDHSYKNITAEQESEFESYCENIFSECGETATDFNGEEFTVECIADRAEVCTGFDEEGVEAAPDPDVQQAGPPLPVAPAAATITPANLGQLITNLYNRSLQILGIAVFVMITYGGVLWLTAAGRGDQIGKAKSKITNAILGAILLLSAAAILNLINPELTKSGTNLIPKLEDPKPAPPGASTGSGTNGSGTSPTGGKDFEGGGGEFGGGGASGDF